MRCNTLSRGWNKNGQHIATVPYCNQTVDVVKIVVILIGINRGTVSGKSKQHVKKNIEKIYEDVLEDGDKSERDKKTYLTGIYNKVTTILPKPDTK